MCYSNGNAYSKIKQILKGNGVERKISSSLATQYGRNLLQRLAKERVMHDWGNNITFGDHLQINIA